MSHVKAVRGATRPCLIESFPSNRIFRHYREAGLELALRLVERHDLIDPVVIALPTRGVRVGLEVALALRAPLDVLLVRKLGLPNQSEKGTRELQRRERAYRGTRRPVEVQGRTVILIDEGAATGSSILAAIRAIRVRKPAAVIVAVPVAPAETCLRLTEEADAVVCVATPGEGWPPLGHQMGTQCTTGETRAQAHGPSWRLASSDSRPRWCFPETRCLPERWSRPVVESVSTSGGNVVAYDLNAEGDRLIVAQNATGTNAAEITAEPDRLILVQNFFEELRQVVPDN